MVESFEILVIYLVYYIKVGIKTPGGESPFCGGTILSRKTILTASHCTIGLKESTLKVVVGDHNFDNKDGEREYRVCRKIEHPNYNT